MQIGGCWFLQGAGARRDLMEDDGGAAAAAAPLLMVVNEG